MSVKDDVKAELVKKGISFDESMTIAQLKALLPTNDAVVQESETDENGFIVSDPEILRPKELPLVITLPEGQNWKNPEQEKYASILNSASYCHPDNWKKVKEVELARLAEIGSNPSRYYVYTGTQPDAPGNVTFKNTVIES